MTTTNIITYEIAKGIDVIDNRPEAYEFKQSLLYLEERNAREQRRKQKHGLLNKVISLLV